MQTLIRRTPICTPALLSRSRCLYRTRYTRLLYPHPRCPLKISICCVAIRPSQTCQTSVKRLLLSLVVSHLRIPVLRRRLYVPLYVRSCPMGCRPRPVPCPPQKPPELTHPAHPEVCTLSATALISRPLRAMPCLREMMSRAITNALPHHISWGSHAQATQCTSSLAVCPRHSPILLNLPLCGPSMPVRWTFNSHAHCSNGFATCKTGEIIDAQACLAKPPRWKARERELCQQTSLVPGSLGRGHSIA
jgi:hypothetical protein